MKQLIEDKGINEYAGVRVAQEEERHLLERLADLRAYISGHEAGAEWLRLENEAEFEAVQKAAGEALEDRVISGSESAKMYDMLAKTPLHDKARGQWNWAMNAEQNLTHSERPSHVQFAGVIALASIGRVKEAGEFYDKLTETALYDKATGLWRFSISDAQQIKSPNFSSCSQLSGVAALALIERKDEAARFYTFLQGTALYDKEKKQWKSEMNNEQGNTTREAYNCLLSSLCLNLISRKEESMETYKLLMETPLYDKSCGQWNENINEEQELTNSNRSSSEQLIGIACLVRNGMAKEAGRLYQQLAESVLYDKQRMQWNSTMNAGQCLKDSKRYAHEQLWGVAALAALGR